MKDFKSELLEFAEAVRDPSTEANYDPRRLAIYQSLFFNNVEGFCATAFPVLKSLFPEPAWKDLVRQFFVEHSAETPHFIEISEEFLEFLTSEAVSLPHPAMLQLAHYEWVELAASVAPNSELTSSDCYDGDQLANTLISVPESTWPLAYEYLVYTISQQSIGEIAPEPTFLIVYRDLDC
jgi:hypothetical protein